MAVDIAHNVEVVFDRMERAARRVGRELSEVTLVAASKSVDVRYIKEAANAGVTVFGENYMQEAAAKIKSLERARIPDISWHFIGSLQKNKAKYAVELFDMVQTVDSIELAKELAKRAQKPFSVLVEVNIAREKTKGGIDVKDVDRFMERLAEVENITVKGLMAIPPYSENPEGSRPYFSTLRRIAERINRERFANMAMQELSMGMSHDFEVAIEEGATLVRVGTAIFGERPSKKGSKK